MICVSEIKIGSTGKIFWLLWLSNCTLYLLQWLWCFFWIHWICYEGFCPDLRGLFPHNRTDLLQNGQICCGIANIKPIFDTLPSPTKSFVKFFREPKNNFTNAFSVSQSRISVINFNENAWNWIGVGIGWKVRFFLQKLLSNKTRNKSLKTKNFVVPFWKIYFTMFFERFILRFLYLLEAHYFATQIGV